MKIAFDPSPDAAVVGYAVYYGEVGGLQTNRLDVREQTWAQLKDLTASRLHFFYVVAYTGEGIESLPSNILYYSPPQMTRMRLARHSTGDMQLTFRMPVNRRCRIEYASSLAAPSWLPAGYATANGDGEVEFIDPVAEHTTRFYRAVLLP